MFIEAPEPLVIIDVPHFLMRNSLAEMPKNNKEEPRYSIAGKINYSSIKVNKKINIFR